LRSPITLRLNETAQNLVLSLGTGAILLAAGEAFFRLREHGHHARKVADYITSWQEWDGDFYTVKSAAVGWPPWEDYNRDGVRDREHALAKPPGEHRVICLGDSTTLGWDIRPQEAYPQVLQDLLDALGGGVEVFNIALAGWSTKQERIAYRKIARRYSPDVVLLGVCLNDIPELQNNLTRPPAFVTALHRRSALVRGLVRAREREIASVEELFTDSGAPRVKDGFARLFEEIRSLQQEVTEDRASLAVLLFPFRFQTSPEAFPPTAQDKIVAFCSSAGIPVLDLLPALRTMGPKAFLDYDHFSPEGARLVAETIIASGLVAMDESGAPAPSVHPPSLPTRDVRALREALREKEPGKRAGAARALANLGPEASGAVSDLARALDDRVTEVQVAAAWALGSVGAPADEAIPALRRRLDDEAPSVRAGAAWALGRLGPKAKEALPALLACLDDRDDSVRFRAGDAVLGLGPEPSMLPALRARLERPGDAGRGVAAEAVGRMGPAGSEAVPSLLLALEDKREEVRWRAAWALGRIGPGARSAVPALIRAMDDSAIRWRVCDALNAIGPAAAPAVPRLIAALDDEAGNVRWRAVQALGAIGPAASLAAPRLVTAATDTQVNVRVAALKALGRVGTAPTLALPAFRRALLDADARTRQAGADGLAQLGPIAAPAIEDLVKALEDGNHGVRARAARALRRMGPLPPAATLALRQGKVEDAAYEDRIRPVQ
jgi:HEAT repeat protein/lysophospholipase L1-like esterase